MGAPTVFKDTGLLGEVGIAVAEEFGPKDKALKKVMSTTFGSKK